MFKSLADIIILVAFLVLALMYYIYMHKWIVSKLDKKISDISLNISISENQVADYKAKILQLEADLVKCEKQLKEDIAQIDATLAAAKDKKIKAIEEEFNKKEQDIKTEAEAEVEIYHFNIKTKIVETAYLVAAEYFKTSNNFSEEDKRKIVEKLLKNIKLS